ncbi:MAG TPA: DUF1707 domain-containing protein [Longimicrobiaceae bacterium]|nr:DUF1707 domain-containing protein [Longimicrobiaceae bacterium]
MTDLSDSSGPAPLPAPDLREAREHAIAELCEHFALDNLEAGELERRIDSAHAAAIMADLDALTADLPARVTPGSAAPADPNVAEERAKNQAVIAVMGGTEQRGHWTPAARVVVVTAMGGAELDFREARLPPGVTDVYVFAVMGGAEIIVPPGLRIESNGIAIMGGWGHSQHDAPERRDPNAPILRIGGLAIMGGVDITERQRGETAKDARIRRREERKQKRLENRRKRLT